MSFHTLDCDILVDPEPKNLLNALLVLSKLNYQQLINDEPILKIDLFLARRIAQNRITVNARKEKEIPLDIVTNAGGIPYEKWNEQKRFFDVEGIKIPVGSLDMLLAVKEKLGRRKDKVFLKLYKTQIKELLRNTRKT